MMPHPDVPQAGPQTDVPPPPPGPGVAVPFAAPPRDRSYKGLWIGLGVGAVVLVLCCVGGVFGIGALIAGSEEIVRSEARSTVRQYLDALQDEDYPGAYDVLCDDLQGQLTLERFETTAGLPRVTGYVVGTVTIAERITVRATVSRQGRSPIEHNFLLAQEGTLKVCGGI